MEISHIDYLPDDIYIILSLLFSGKWKELYIFDLELSKEQLQTFSQVFKQTLNDYINNENEKRKINSKIMEYTITDNEFSISF